MTNYAIMTTAKENASIWCVPQQQSQKKQNSASPVPAKRSNHLLPGGNRGWLPAILATMLNTAPRTFSIMGLVPSPGGDTKRRPAAEPVMMRMLPTVARAFAVFFFFRFTCEYIVFG